MEHENSVVRLVCAVSKVRYLASFSLWAWARAHDTPPRHLLLLPLLLLLLLLLLLTEIHPRLRKHILHQVLLHPPCSLLSLAGSSRDRTILHTSVSEQRVKVEVIVFEKVE